MIRAFLRNPAIRAESEALLHVLIRIFAYAEREHYVDSDNNLVPQGSAFSPSKTADASPYVPLFCELFTDYIRTTTELNDELKELFLYTLLQVQHNVVSLSLSECLSIQKVLAKTRFSRFCVENQFEENEEHLRHLLSIRMDELLQEDPEKPEKAVLLNTINCDVEKNAYIMSTTPDNTLLHQVVIKHATNHELPLEERVHSIANALVYLSDHEQMQSSFSCDRVLHEMVRASKQLSLYSPQEILDSALTTAISLLYRNILLQRKAESAYSTDLLAEAEHTYVSLFNVDYLRELSRRDSNPVNSLIEFFSLGFGGRKEEGVQETVGPRRALRALHSSSLGMQTLLIQKHEYGEGELLNALTAFFLNDFRSKGYVLKRTDDFEDLVLCISGKIHQKVDGLGESFYELTEEEIINHWHLFSDEFRFHYRRNVYRS